MIKYIQYPGKIFGSKDIQKAAYACLLNARITQSVTDKPTAAVCLCLLYPRICGDMGCMSSICLIAQ